MVSSQIEIAEVIIQFNEFRLKQERQLIVTHDHILKLKHRRKIRNSFAIVKLEAITINLTQGKEMLFHIEG